MAVLYDLPLLEIFGVIDAPYVQKFTLENKDFWHIYFYDLSVDSTLPWVVYFVNLFIINVIFILFVFKYLFRSTEPIIYTTEGLN
jgi:hypothetical protein